jgi:hypothetical protein
MVLLRAFSGSVAATFALVAGCSSDVPIPPKEKLDARRDVVQKNPLVQEGVRAIEIPFEEHGYSNFESHAIRSQPELDRFIDRISRQQGSWNERTAFITAIQNAKVNFEEEVLCLLRHTEGSGSIQVRFQQLRFDAKTMTCNVVTRIPEACTCDMAYYCVALAVAANRVDNVDILVDGRRSASFAIKAE